MSSTRRTAFVAGLFYLLTFAAIPTLRLYREIKEPGYAVGPASDAAARLGGFLEVLVAFACIGTAVTLYPVLRRQQPGVALGFVAARSLEAAAIFMGVASLMTLVRNKDGVYRLHMKKWIVGVLVLAVATAGAVGGYQIYNQPRNTVYI